MKPLIRLVLFGLLASASAWSAPAPAPSPSPSPSPATPAEEEEEGIYKPKTLDGVMLEAVESYPNPSDSSLGLGLGIYPFNGYYSALLINLNYLHRLSRSVQWELINLSYAYTYDKDLTTELADRFGVNPRQIDRLEFMASSNVLLTMAHGKFIWMDDHIRYFNTAFVLGAGAVRSTQTQGFTGNFGFRGEVFTSDRFSWRLDARDQLNMKSGMNFEHFVTFMLSTGLGF